MTLGLKSRSHEGLEMNEPCFERFDAERITIKQTKNHVVIREVRQQRAVARDDELLSVLTLERASVHFPIEKGDRPKKERTQRCAEVVTEAFVVTQRFSTHNGDDGGIEAEELKRCFQDPVDEIPPVELITERLFDSQSPIAKGLLDHFAIDRLFVGKVVKQAGATDPDAGRDVVERRALESLVGEAQAGFAQY